MKHTELREVMRELNKKINTFSYSRDDYCLQLLRYEFGEQASINRIKRSAYKGLLDKPAMKALSASLGGGRMDLKMAAVTGADSNTDFRLSFAKWGGFTGYRQVSRAGWQLVIQLNFPDSHDQVYRQKVKPKNEGPFVYTGHPVCGHGLNTLAWARVDLDPFCEEALIEEVQTDWLREAKAISDRCKTYKSRKWQRRDLKHETAKQTRLEDVLDYIRTDLKPYHSIWQEALMSACFHVLFEQLGYRRVYMHSWKTGQVLKNCQPPRSLYSQLPKRFCMRAVPFGPGMLTSNRQARLALRKASQPFWFRHCFGEVRDGIA